MPPGRTDPPRPDGRGESPLSGPARAGDPCDAGRPEVPDSDRSSIPARGPNPPRAAGRGLREALGTDGPGGPAASHAGGVAVLAEPPLGAIRTDRARHPLSD